MPLVLGSNLTPALEGLRYEAEESEYPARSKKCEELVARIEKSLGIDWKIEEFELNEEFELDLTASEFRYIKKTTGINLRDLTKYYPLTLPLEKWRQLPDFAFRDFYSSESADYQLTLYHTEAENAEIMEKIG